MYFDPVTGLTADALFAPEGLPSRMTKGMIYEGIFGSGAMIEGNLLCALDDQDMFIPIENRLQVVEGILREAGFHSSGRRVVIDGRTGKQVEASIFVGIISYFKLNHMVSKKVHVRANGPILRVSRGPTEGRRDNGGIRLGFMEVEALTAHGNASIIHERLTKTADKHTMFVCKACGRMAKGNDVIRYYFCKYCQTSDHVRNVEIGYATKLFVQEIMCEGINVKFELEDL